MSKAKFEAARQAIDSGDYATARAILRTIEEPIQAVRIAGRWLARLDTLEKRSMIGADDRSFYSQAVLTFALYWLFILPGLVANVLFLHEAERAEWQAGKFLPGVGALRLMWRLVFWGGIVGFAVLVVLLITLLVRQ